MEEKIQGRTNGWKDLVNGNEQQMNQMKEQRKWMNEPVESFEATGLWCP